MREGRRRWVVFALCAAGVAAALVWVTAEALAVERRAHEIRLWWRNQDALLLALWQMDAEVASLVHTESSRPHYHYEPFYGEKRLWDRDSFEPIETTGALVPSPLLIPRGGEQGSQILLHFECKQGGSISSPQVPRRQLLELAGGAGLIDSDLLRAHQSRLLALSNVVDYERLAEALLTPPDESHLDLVPEALQDDDRRWREAREKMIAEYRRRAERALAGNTPNEGPTRLRTDTAGAVQQGAFRPVLFADPENGRVPWLLFVRPVRTSPERLIIQGFWVDWPALRQSLLSGVSARFPNGRPDLVPLFAMRRGTTLQGALASLPALLVIRDLPEAVLPTWSYIRSTLLVAWLAVVGGLVAAGWSLRAAHQLSDRRGRFVSAVTHELRTPLTTFCMYSEMLAKGMVADADAQREYHQTLHTEAERLRRIVDDVLAYARLDDGRSAPRIERRAVADVVEQVREALEQRASSGGKRLETVVTEAVAAHEADVDLDAVELILANLVDNACKYSREASDPRIDFRAELVTDRGTRHIELSIRDYGPGIPDGAERDVFEAFRRAAGDRAGEIPGIGLGLSLARGMARRMGGDVVLLPTPEGGGAAFGLRLPVATT